MSQTSPRPEPTKIRDRIALRRAVAPVSIAYPEELPITQWREVLLEAIATNQLVVVAGETGSGKSTQLPKMCLELGRGVAGMIGHTQPRRIAARSIAERVADELDGAVGAVVGYAVRFTDRVGDATLVKVMTDGILLNEIHRDPELARYDTLIIDEAHERSLNVDFLLGYIKRLLPRRPDLKVIITSATIDTARFSAHFDNAPVVEVSGRSYPVEVRYRPLEDARSRRLRDQPTAIADAVVELAVEGDGDVLVFCSGEREIRDAAEAIRDLGLARTEVLPLYGRLSAAEQHRVFSAHRGWRIIVATNVAETSLTVPGIRYVVDAGTARISRYNRRTKVQRLPIEPISQASADQRSGRCGRLGPGICIRLYAEDEYELRPEFTDPEILRTNLASVILQMAAIGLGEVADFPFLDPPDTRNIRDGVALLAELGAVDPERHGTDEWLTGLGRRLARIPLDPRLGRMLLAAGDEDCLSEVLVIASALSIVDPRERPDEKEQQADQSHARFLRRGSDLLGWLDLWAYLRKQCKELASSRFRAMCRDEYFNHRRVREWQDIHAQLRRVADGLGLVSNRNPAVDRSVHRALLAGLLSQIGKKDPDRHEYLGARGARFAINPGSALFKTSPPWVMAAELVETRRMWARGVAVVEPVDIETVGSHLVNRTTSDPWWDAEAGSAVASQTVSIFGLPLAEARKVHYGRIDPVAARELFIRHALVGREWQTHHEFWVRNQTALDEVLAMEARSRRTDLLISDRAIESWYSHRIPNDVVSVRHFDRWWRDLKSAEPHRLDLSSTDLLDPDADAVDEEAFPHHWLYGDLALPIEYTFDLHSESDGVTIELPAEALHRLDTAVFTWNVPGLREELIEALLRGLPKEVRRAMVPIPDSARRMAKELSPDTGPIHLALQREVTRITGAAVPFDAFDMAKLPRHLRPRLRVIDREGAVVAEADEIEELRSLLRSDATATVAAATHPLERSGITEWDFGELPQMVALTGAGHDVTAYPALVDEDDSVAIRLLPTRDERSDAMWAGVRRLLVLSFAAPDKLVRSVLDRDVSLTLVGGPYASYAAYADDALTAALDASMIDAGIVPWDETAFERLRDRVRDRLADRLDEVATASVAVFNQLETVDERLQTLPAEQFATATSDVDDQIGQLVYNGFLTGVGADRLPDISRYLEAAAWRLARLPENPARDSTAMITIHALEDRFDEMIDALGPSRRLLDIAWMLQELRVSLFAESVGATGPISAKRVSAALDAVLAGG